MDDQPEVVSGTDEDGLVTMTVTVDRADVLDVALAENWRRVIASTELAGTVVRAFHAAQAAAIAWQLEHPDTATPTGPEDGETGPAPEYVQDLVFTVLDQLDDYAARTTRVRTARFETDSPRRAVTVTTSGGQLAAVTVDPEWARRAPATDLAGELRSAFAAAQARTEELVAEAGGPTREMAELTELAMNPARFIGLVGMRGARTDRS